DDRAVVLEVDDVAEREAVAFDLHLVRGTTLRRAAVDLRRRGAYVVDLGEGVGLLGRRRGRLAHDRLHRRRLPLGRADADLDPRPRDARIVGAERVRRLEDLRVTDERSDVPAGVLRDPEVPADVRVERNAA